MRTPSLTAAGARRVTRLTILTTVLASGALLAGACATPRGSDGGADSAVASGNAGGVSAAGAARGETAPPPGGDARITLELDRTRYAPGGTVNVRIVSQDDAGYGFSACQRQIERRRSGEWFSIPEEGRMCTMMLQLIGARQTVMVETELPSPLEAGEYRLVLTFSREEGPAPGRDTPAPAAAPTRVASAPFRVE
jgi:hypothetical protein